MTDQQIKILGRLSALLTTLLMIGSLALIAIALI
jgi:hypothetical protein